jgi:hypothetical protein
MVPHMSPQSIGALAIALALAPACQSHEARPNTPAAGGSRAKTTKTSSPATVSSAAPKGSGEAGVDFSSPQKLFATFKLAVHDWDIDRMFRCFGGDPNDAAHLAKFRKEFSHEKDEIVACMASATLAKTEPTHTPNEINFALDGCPSKKGFTGGMAKGKDGSWHITHM